MGATWPEPFGAIEDMETLDLLALDECQTLTVGPLLSRPRTWCTYWCHWCYWPLQVSHCTDQEIQYFTVFLIAAYRYTVYPPDLLYFQSPDLHCYGWLITYRVSRSVICSNFIFWITWTNIKEINCVLIYDALDNLEICLIIILRILHLITKT